MISLNLGTKTYPLTRKEAAFITESLISVVSGRPVTAPAFISGMHGHISFISKKAKPSTQGANKEDGIIRSNPPQSDHVLTGC